MIIYNKQPKLGDPSNRIQKFDSLHINILCCRYWWLSQWKSKQMSFPYWRLYWNKTPGAYVVADQKVEIGPDTIVLIPPFTVFSTDIENLTNAHASDAYLLKGNRINNPEEEIQSQEQQRILHMFIHFNIGGLLNHTFRGIYTIPMDPSFQLLIDEIRSRLMTDQVTFNTTFSLYIHHLIIAAINKIPEEALRAKMIDERIERCIIYIDENIGVTITNEKLAGICNMATNSFARLFQQHMHSSPQQYIQKLRVARASELLDHSNYSTEEIAYLIGFSDRSHFSKLFKRHRGVSPAEYKKRFIINQNNE